MEIDKDLSGISVVYNGFELIKCRSMGSKCEFACLFKHLKQTYKNRKGLIFALNLFNFID